MHDYVNQRMDNQSMFYLFIFQTKKSFESQEKEKNFLKVNGKENNILKNTALENTQM